MNSLAILISGQLRTFIEDDEFTIVLNRCIEQYRKILIICVLNSNNETDFEQLKTYFSNFNIFDIIIVDYTKNEFQDEFNQVINNKYEHPKFIELRNRYMNLNTDAHNELPDPIEFKFWGIGNQFHQYSIALKTLADYQNKNNIKFDITFKTRFDLRYPLNFFPYLPTKTNNIIDFLSFNDINKTQIFNSMNQYNLNTLDDLINFNKYNNITLPNCRIEYDKSGLSFGGEFFYNYIALELIKESNLDIIYSFGQFAEIGQTNIMLKFEKIFNDFYTIDPPDDKLFIHFCCAEIQMLIYALNYNIPLLVFRKELNFFKSRF